MNTDETMTMAELRELIVFVRSQKVAVFEGCGLRVQFAPDAFVETPMDAKAIAKAAAADAAELLYYSASGSADE